MSEGELKKRMLESLRRIFKPLKDEVSGNQLALITGAQAGVNYIQDKILDEAKNSCPVWYMGEDRRCYYPWEMKDVKQKYILYAVDNVPFLKWFKKLFGDNK